MQYSKKDLIRLLETIAVYLELKGENPFKINAFRKAARSLELDERPIEEIEDYTKLPGIGKGTASVIDEFLQTGKSSVLEKLQQEVPKGLILLLQIPGLGGKTIAKLYKSLGITNVEELKEACLKGEVAKIKGFGKKTEEKILAAIKSLGTQPERLPYHYMLPISNWLEEELQNMTDIVRYSRAGSMRRLQETVKDLDYIIATNNVSFVKEQLHQLPKIKSITNDGETKISCVFEFEFDVQVDFRIVKPEQFATALHHFTGSKEHNVRMRQLAKARDEKISEYGVEKLTTGDVLTFESESDLYKHFGLPYIAPELREDGTEIDRIEKLEQLVSLQDIRGDLHMHTTWSDGAHSLEDMVLACREKGYQFMAITDHSQFLKVANGLTPERLKRQMEIIQELNEKYSDITILAGIEMDILPDGTLDFPDEILSELDFVIAAIHSGFNQSEDMIMKRLEAACRNPYVDIIAHPTGRKIGTRDGYAVNMDKLIQMAKETNKILELNANPMRFDLKIDHLKQAQQSGVHIAINTDSHHKEKLDYMALGVQYARKAWIEKETVVNTWSIEQLLTFLKEK